MLRRPITLALMFLLLASVGLYPKSARAFADEKKFTAEQIAESAIYIYGTRPGLAQVRRNGLERGRLTRTSNDGRPEEGIYERRFIRGESQDKDKIRLDQKLPSVEYSLVYGGGQTWGILNGTFFTPRQDATTEFLSQMWHGLDALLRYKENGSTLNLIGKDKQQNVEVYVLDVTDKEKRRTRYFISTKSARVLWLEYEEGAGATPVKYMRRFYDYRYAQGTLVPYRTVFFVDGKQALELQVMTVTYGVKLEEALFQNPETQSTAARP